MKERPLKPKAPEVRQALKELKDDYDSHRINLLEPTLLRKASLSREPRFVMWKAETFHQLALQAERRDEIAKARSLYEASLRAFRESEYLGRARTMRDYAMLLCYHISTEEGLEYALQALALHEHDLKNTKGLRQQRVTRGYVLRAKVLARVDAEEAMTELVELALYGCHDFCLRDQHILINFVRPHVSDTTKLELDKRVLDIYANRGKPLPAAVSIVRLVVDVELIVATRILRKIFRKE